MFASVIAFFSVFSALAAAQNTPSVVCIAGQCVQGFTNLTLGATLSAPGASTSLLLLPGQYTETTNPSLLHSILTSSSATISGSTGFQNSSSISLPLSIQLQPGLAFYSSSNYSGSAAYIALPTSANASNVTTTINGGSFVLSSNTWAELTTSGGRIILWDASPDISQLPGFISSGLTLNQLQSGSCSTPCASGGVCTSQGSCACLPGFTGSSCEACATGFFGKNCQACPSDCETCDDGINGSGICLKKQSNAQNCNCLNGQCASDGSCACNAGWVDSSNGTKCASCANGFFLSDDGSCKVCELGCATCAASTGACTACKSGFTLSSTDSTKCNPPSTATTTGTVCPDGSFANGASCAACNSLCSTCTGATANDCVVCGTGRFQFNGTCVTVDGNGVCQTGLTTGNGFVADNNKKECEACPEKCTACGIPSFSIASTIDQVQCTACLSGFVLSSGQCVENCPSGTFLDPKDNVTCSACSSTCSTCAGSATFCLTCSNNQLASGGACVTSCPSGTFSSSGACVSCHPDCTTCSGTSFNQCSTCPSDRPVLSNGRCLPICSKNEFFDPASSSCKSCDSSCASCSGSGSSNCLSCADGNSVLRGGKCVAGTCAANTDVVPGLGACLSDLVAIPQASGSGTASGALPTVTGINSPTVDEKGGSHLEWWQILLMALGCAFILLCLLLCLRRRMRKKRAQQTQEFARAKKLDDNLTWRERVVRFGERLFGHTLGERVLGSRKRGATGPIALRDVGKGTAKDSYQMRDLEEARYSRDVDKLLDGYAYSRHSREPSLNTYEKRSDYLSRLHGDAKSKSSRSKSSRFRRDRDRSADKDVDLNTMSDESMYTYLTGQPRRTADARQPVRDKPAFSSRLTPLDTNARDLDRGRDRLASRFSDSMYSESNYAPPRDRRRRDHSPASNASSSRAPTPAQEYALTVRDREHSPANRGPAVDYGLIDLGNQKDQYGGRGDYWLRPNHTGASSGSKNPFRR
ncbi:uncharacterized protein FOMMEDRAFT_126919 [Fomitiporia mediterranea MF3/22]|uniref:uncharacterized protein n=1 Tax=Fomitiporia mediterranea (strain MF3/22) TaxID=694068 RepID=UPI0004408492|nr:uncharacterized protein FOMMEDRAFT_126919 [Fomitiporia mediterranea MF3/22]EJD01756.1 hypothetical protein FOMMEDRAFT_126919 [Fomitiporia mediterranea MF3/22]